MADHKRTARLTHDGKLLTITIGKKVSLYVVENVNPDKNVADPAFNLIGPGGGHYTVHVDQHGIHCDCPDSIWRKRRGKNLCKHCAALVVVGLVPKEGS